MEAFLTGFMVAGMLAMGIACVVLDMSLAALGAGFCVGAWTVMGLDSLRGW